MIENFTTIGMKWSSPYRPATKQDWLDFRKSEKIAAIAARVEKGEKEAKAELPSWTPRCAGFLDNKRSDDNATVPIYRRLLIDVDEKGHTDEILEKMEDRNGEKWLGIFRVLLVEESIRHGTHILVRLPLGMSIQKAQERFEDIIGLEVDKKVKEHSRAILFVPESYTRFIDEAMFDEVEQDMESNEVTPALNIAERSSEKSDAAVERPAIADDDYYKGFPMSRIIDKYWELFRNGETPTEGCRFDETRTLALNLAPACRYDLSLMEKAIPIYDNFPLKEWQAVLNYAVNAPRSKGTPYRLNKVVKALRQEQIFADLDASPESAPPMPKRLPSLIQLAVKNTPDECKPMVANAVLSALSTHLRNVSIRYVDNKVHYPNIMDVCIATQASGKGACDDVIEVVLEQIREDDKTAYAKITEWKQNNPASKTSRDPRPRVCVQVQINNQTEAAFCQNVLDAWEDGRKTLYINIPEMDGLLQMVAKRNVEGLNFLIKNAYDGAQHGQNRVGSDSVSGTAPLHFSFHASTQPVRAKKLLGRGLDDGTFSRLSVTTITPSASSKIPKYGIYDEAYKEQMNLFIERLREASGEVAFAQCNKLAEKMAEENNEYAEMIGSEAYKILSRRANVIAWRKAMIIAIAQGGYDKTVENFQRWAYNYDMWCKMKFFGCEMEAALTKDLEVYTAKGPENMLVHMPDAFTKEACAAMYAKRNQTFKSSTLRSWKNRGYIYFDDITKTYCKTDKYFEKYGKAVG